MRILGLHGMGTSADIFKAQTSSFRGLLDSSYVFDFKDGPFPAQPAPGIDLVYPDSGYYSWYAAQTPTAVQAALHHLEDLLSQEDYDCVMCFSQGCVLLISYLLYHAKNRPNEPLPFRSAMFICGGVPLAVLEDLGFPVSDKAKEISAQTSKMLNARTSRIKSIVDGKEDYDGPGDLWRETDDLVHDPKQQLDPKDVFGLDFEEIRSIATGWGHNGSRGCLVKIPTVHVYGAKDPRFPGSLQLSMFCENRLLYDHGGGHDIPRFQNVSQKLAHLLQYLEGETLSGAL